MQYNDSDGQIEAYEAVLGGQGKGHLNAGNAPKEKIKQYAIDK